MKRDRHYRSPAQKRIQKQIFIIFAIVLLIALVITLPILFLKKNPSNSSAGSEQSNTGFRWPWQKKEEPTPTQTTAIPVLSNVDLEEGLTNDVTSSPSDPNLQTLPNLNSMAGNIATLPQNIYLEISALDFGAPIKIVQQIDYTNYALSALNSLLLHFPATPFVTPNDQPFSRVIMDAVALDRTSYDLKRAENLLEISLKKPLASNETVRIILTYEITLPEGNMLLSRSGSYFRLNDFYAYPAQYLNNTWVRTPPSALPLINFEVNISLPNSVKLGYSGSRDDMVDLADRAAVRYKLSSSSARKISLFSYSSDFREETITVGSSRLNNYASHSSTIMRVSELSQAILPYYEARLGASHPNINVFQSQLDRPYFVIENLIYYDSQAFNDTDEFRYQYALALAELYFPKQSVMDNKAQAFNEILIHELASSYIIQSQGVEKSEFAYAHCPEARQLSELRKSIGEVSFDSAMQSYRLDAIGNSFDLSRISALLPEGIPSSIDQIISNYQSRNTNF